MSGGVPLVPPYSFLSWTGKNLSLPSLCKRANNIKCGSYRIARFCAELNWLSVGTNGGLLTSHFCTGLYSVELVPFM